MAYVSLSRMPTPRKTHTLDFPCLDGGLNLRDAEINLKANESPRLRNMQFEDGILQARFGQQYATAAPSWGGKGFTVTDSPFRGHIFLHIGNALYTLPQGVSEDNDGDSSTPPEPLLIASGIPANRGTFFHFGDFLFYKNRGGFFKIEQNANTGGFSVSNVAENAFVPTILINAAPESGAGDLYQPENRLSPTKRVTYNASTVDRTVIFNATGRQSGDGISADFAQKTDGIRRAFIVIQLKNRRQ